MKHPFANIAELSKQEVKHVSGARLQPTGTRLYPIVPKRPPVATTMAIGEEGGSDPRWHYM